MSERFGAWRSAVAHRRRGYYIAKLVHDNGTVHYPSHVPHGTREGAQAEADLAIARWQATGGGPL